MAHITKAIVDSSGGKHSTPEAATISDLSKLLGNNKFGCDVFAKRAQIEELFRQHDEVVRALT